MISDLLSELLIVATVALVAMPLVAGRVRTAFRPVELTRYNSITISSGGLLLLVSLVLCAAPVIIALGGGTVVDRHFFPGDGIIGWISAVGAATVIVTMVIGIRRVWVIEARLRVEHSIGEHYPMADFDLVVLDTDQLVAYSIGGSHSQIVITHGLVEQLSVQELVSVVEHEAAHISLHHRLHLTLIGMIEPAARWFLPARQLANTLRSALEHAADAQTSDYAATRRALLATLGVRTAVGVAGFTAGNVLDRLDALDHMDVPPRTTTRTLMYVSAAALCGISLTTLVLFWL